MKNRVSREIIIVLVMGACIGLGSVARAAHATNFLDALQAEVTDRLADLDSETAAQKAALRAAANILGRNTKTLSGDLIALAASARVLNKRFDDDAAFLALENSALVAYSNEAHRQFDGAKIRAVANSNSIPRRTMNQLLQASNAIVRFDANTNELPPRARALAQAFNKLRIPFMKILEQFPDAPFEAPNTIAPTWNIKFNGPEINSPGPEYFFHATDPITGNPFTYFCNNPPEGSDLTPGTWQYMKTGPKTAVLHCTPPGPPGQHDFTLTFTSTVTGTFTGIDSLGHSIQGQFYID